MNWPRSQSFEAQKTDISWEFVSSKKVRETAKKIRSGFNPIIAIGEAERFDLFILSLRLFG